MKFLAILPVALAAVSVAHAFDAQLASPHMDYMSEYELEPRAEGDVHMTAEELDAAGTSFNSPFGQMLPVSTKCAAHPRTDVAGCPSVGHLKHPSKRLFIYGIKFQRCANTCTCRFKTSNDCQAFAWKEGTKKPGRGRCIIYSETLSDMGYTDAPRAETDFPTRTFYNRSCYHKGKPYPTNIQTELPAQATPATKRVRRDDIRADIVAAMERV